MFRNIYKHLVSNPQYLIYAYFVFIAGYIAVSIAYSIPPDEAIHYKAIEYYSRHTPDPWLSTQEDSFVLGEIVRTGSYFYYYVMGFVYNFAETINRNPLIVIRFISVTFGLLTIIYLNRIADKFRLEKKIKLATLFFIANLPMFLIVASSVNYDIPIIFLSSFVSYLLLSVSKKFSYADALKVLIVISIGPVIKFAFAPISLASFLVLLYLFISKKKKKLKRNKNRHSIKKVIKITLLILFFALSSLIFFERYYVNYKNHGQLNPDCDVVLTEEQCLENFIYRRAEIYEEANLKEPDVNHLNYVSEWVQLMHERTYGILAHKSFTINFQLVYIGMFLSLVLLLILIRKIKTDKYALIFILPFILYTYFLYKFNLSYYISSQKIDLTVQGRYIFPVLLPMAVYIVYLNNLNFKKIHNSFAYNLLVVFLVALALLNGPINLYYGSNRYWYRNYENNIDKIEGLEK